MKEKKVSDLIYGFTLKAFRKEKKITQKQLANEIGRSEISIRKYESGDISIPYEIFWLLIIKFDITKIQFVNFIESAILNLKANDKLKNFSETELLDFSSDTNYFITELFPTSSIAISDKQHFINKYDKSLFNNELKQNFSDSLYIYISGIIKINFSNLEEVVNEKKKIPEIKEQVLNYLNFLLKEKGIIK